MASITSNKGMSGFVLGVEFVNGRASTDAPAALAFFKSSPEYVVDGADGKTPAPAPAAPETTKK